MEGREAGRGRGREGEELMKGIGRVEGLKREWKEGGWREGRRENGVAERGE